MAKTELATKLEKMAVDLIDRAKEADTALAVQVDVFKAVSAFHLGNVRAKRGEDDEPPENSFDSFAKRITAAGSGGNGIAAPGADAATH